MIIIFGKWKVWSSLASLLKYMKYENILMDDADRDDRFLEKADKIVVSPWVTQNHKLYKKYGNKTISELNFLDWIIKKNNLRQQIEFIAVTGTNWKSTSVHILFETMKRLIMNTEIHLSWNFGTPLSETLLDILKTGKNKKHLIILECSSFMLYKLKDFQFEYSILTNIAKDHLDRHKDFQEYTECKTTLLQHTTKYWITNQEIQNTLDTATQEKIAVYEENYDLQKTQFLWKHNESNRNAIEQIIKKYFKDHKLNRNQQYYQEVIKKVKPLEHRMSLLREIRGIKIYDDGICTSSQALNAALSCFNEKIILITWGYDKWDDYTRLADEFKNKVAFACFIGRTKEKLNIIFDQQEIEYQNFDKLPDCVEWAYKMAKEKWTNTILFSPGAASFDMFKNVYERVNKFEKFVNEL